MCIAPSPQPERLVLRKDEAVRNKKIIPKHNYKFDNNLLTVEPRAVEPHCFDADLDPDLDPHHRIRIKTMRIHSPGLNCQKIVV